MTCKHIIFAAASIFFPALLSAQAIKLQRSYISVVVDASLSMGQQMGSASKMSAVQENLSVFFTKLDDYPELMASLAAFGSSRTSTDPQHCTDYKFLAPLGIGNTPRLISALKRVAPYGTSPLTNAMRTAVKALPAEEAKKYVLILTDGGDSCMELMCGEYAQQDSLTDGIFFIGLGIPAEDQELFSCAPTFANADSSTELAAALQRILDAIKPY